ncbi:hypothetical protein SAM23877_p013 (plasmid) [Streptomyces ambofaciens ATCC 23877]|uniref:Uncharacterized protein n=1 Tax=Streptomyces ambofaciens (strain ATCC 23877 / 3486 / DSM 40053 / JCM 4204 / NBRC 12836 / NRRL B-2516) TaxID=278992 RepID=A0A0K2B6N4_STRA7|nr:hypothetical protein [Streptomyces ambofaciens]AKZ60722.1 hypothetical protein SAM23877_p013 [Streptomyces ambofaciens ATCC 23877]
MEDFHRQYAERSGIAFLDALRALPPFVPAPGIDLGQLRITATLLVPDHSLVLGHADLDPVNLRGLADATVFRGNALRTKHAHNPVITSRPKLHLLEGGGQR